MSFSPKKHKSLVQSHEERASPCKITKFSPHATEANTIWINPNTQINDALDTTVHFSKEECISVPDAPTCQTKDLDEMQIHQKISIRGYVVFGERQPEQVPSKNSKELIKREGCVIDEVGYVPITLWNDQIKSVQPGYYDIKEICLRQFLGKKYISTSTETIFTKISKDPPSSITAESLSEALDSLKLEEVNCDGKIIRASVQVYYSCVACSKKVLYQQEPMLRCGNCQFIYQLINSFVYFFLFVCLLVCLFQFIYLFTNNICSTNYGKSKNKSRQLTVFPRLKLWILIVLIVFFSIENRYNYFPFEISLVIHIILYSFCIILVRPIKSTATLQTNDTIIRYLELKSSDNIYLGII